MIEQKIIITQRAYSDIIECVFFVNNVSKKAAQDLYSEIINSIESLKSYPNAYPCIEGLTIGGINIRKMPIHHGRYLVIYKVDVNSVTIYDVIDSRKDNLLAKLFNN